jgi:hypothetical protein
VPQFKCFGTTERIKIWFRRKLRRDWILAMLAAIRSRTFCLPVYCPKTSSSVWVRNLFSDRENHRLRAFENRVLRRICGWKRDEVTGGWRKLLKEELHKLCSSPIMIRVLKSIRMRCTGHVARMGRRGTHIWYYGEMREERNHQKDQDIGEWIILRCILEWQSGEGWTELSWLRIGAVGGLLWKW